ncbi:hypothetical protein AAFN86_28725 [Roseomonas sp. CAU 1739]|uniref:hypothetical protein n=1 Tax=Roseomonas sp. CAU 1739 TaxID=3140364 RepID=UPI00325A5F5D
MIRTYLPNEGGTFGVAFREMILEQERLNIDAAKPSRLDALFACRSEADLRHFMQTNSRFRDIPYEVELVGPAPLHFGDHTLPLLAPGVAYFDAFAARARSYWAGPPPVQNVEVLIGGPVKIVQRLP